MTGFRFLSGVGKSPTYITNNATPMLLCLVNGPAPSTGSHPSEPCKSQLVSNYSSKLYISTSEFIITLSKMLNTCFVVFISPLKDIRICPYPQITCGGSPNMAKSWTVPFKMPLHLDGFWFSNSFMELNPPSVHIIGFILGPFGQIVFMITISV